MTEIDPFGKAPARQDSGEDDVPRDRYGRYLLTDPETGKVKPWTRATTFAKSISDTFTLSQWSQRMVGIGVATNPDLIATFASSSVNDRAKLNDAAEEAKNRAGAKTGANLGTAVHQFTQNVDGGTMPVSAIPQPWRRDVIAYRTLLEQEGIEIEEIEKRCLEPRFGIAGTFDRIVRLTRDIDVRMIDPATGEKTIVTLKAGRRYIFDLKTGRDLEYGWMEIAIQLAIYSHATHMYDTAGGPEPMPSVDWDVALVLHLPVGTGKATLHAVNVATGYALAKLCADVRAARKVKGLAAPIAVVEIPEDYIEHGDGLIRVKAERADAVPGELRGPTWDERIASARTVGDLSTIRAEALVAKAWTPTVERKALARRDAILADTVGG